MKVRSFKRILVICCIVSAMLVLHVRVRSALAQQSPTAVAGFGVATAAPFISYVGHDGVVRQVFSVNTIGNRIDFSFNARKAENDEVEGEMQLVDHTLGIVVHSDVAEFDIHRMHNRPVGSTGSTAARMRSSTESVVVDGEPRPAGGSSTHPCSMAAIRPGTQSVSSFSMLRTSCSSSGAPSYPPAM